MHDIDQAALDAATDILKGPKHINPVREKARIQCIIIDAMKGMNTRHTPEGWRPDNCRNELQAKGKPYPKSGCAVCGNGGMAGCPYERQLAAAPKWGE